MKAVIVPVTPFQQNCTLLWCEETMEGVIIDPGGEVDRVLEGVAIKGVNLVKILVTHGHIDHASGVAKLEVCLNIPIEGPHKDDLFWIEGLVEQANQFGLGELIFHAVTRQH